MKQLHFFLLFKYATIFFFEIITYIGKRYRKKTLKRNTIKTAQKKKCQQFIVTIIAYRQLLKAIDIGGFCGKSTSLLCYQHTCHRALNTELPTMTAIHIIEKHRRRVWELIFFFISAGHLASNLAGEKIYYS